MLKRTSGIHLPKDHPSFEIIKNDLHRVLYGWNGDTQEIEFFEDMGDYILIPRFYPVPGEFIRDCSSDGDDIEIESNIVPRDKRQVKAIQFLCDNKRGILRLEPGSGKTVNAIGCISRIKKRSIIFAHKDKLLLNWKKEFLLHTNLTEKDIGRLSVSNYKKVLTKKIILCAPHVIGYAVKNNKKEFLNALQNSGIGITFIDECHVGVGPEHFSKASLYLNSARTYGLSATPTRSDNCTDIIHFHLGDVQYFIPEEGELLKPTICMIYFPFGVFEKYEKYMCWGGKFNLARYYKQLHKIDKYNNIVSKLINKSYNEGKTSLILGQSINSLLVVVKGSGVPKEDVGIFIPGTTKEQRLQYSDTDNLDVAFETKKVIPSTYLACRDGNNRKDLDCLIMATPTGNVEQAAGRILRVLANKAQPLVIDLVDTEGPLVQSAITKTKIPWFVRSALKRKEEYSRLGWDVKVIHLKMEN